MKAALPRGLTHVTAQLNVNYLSPGRGGRLIGRGRVVRVGARVGYAQARSSTGKTSCSRAPPRRSP